ncbi:6660_t:CDS:10, partial [Paraglomus brasilianum]
IEFDLHSLILDKLSKVLSSNQNTSDEEIDHLIARCPVLSESSLGLMIQPYQDGIIALSSFAASTNNKLHVERILVLLLKYLQNLPHFKFEETLKWKDLCPPDELAGRLIGELLNVARNFPDTREEIVGAILNLTERLVNLLQSEDDVANLAITVLPLINGTLRSLQISSLEWTLADFEAINNLSLSLLSNELIQHISGIIEKILKSNDDSDYYAKKVLFRYSNSHILLSSNGLVLNVLQLMQNMLARILLITSNNEVVIMGPDQVWTALVSSGMNVNWTLDEKTKNVLRGTYVMALQYYTELEKLMAQGKDVPTAKSVIEIMAASLKLAAVAGVCLHEVDYDLNTKISRTLFITPQTPDVKVQTAALDAAALISLNFPQKYASTTIQLIKKFLTTPSTIFELATTAADNLTIQRYAIRRLADCLRATNDENQIVSMIYELQNMLVARGYDRSPSRNVPADHISINSSTSGTEEQKLQVCENLVCTIAGITCILQIDKITSLAEPILRQRIRNHAPAIDVIILENLVNIALIAPRKVFEDILQHFSTISMQSLSPKNKIITTAVLKCQHELANRISARPEFYDFYLTKILELFVEKGVVIQKTVAEHGRVQVTSLAAELGILLPILSTLLSHRDFIAHLNPSEDLVSLFRNVWFHCVLYGFVSETTWMREWCDSLVIIAQKTPPLVLESATNYLEYDLEYNSVLVRGYSEQDLVNLRALLSGFLPEHAYEIRNYSFAQITFLLSVYHIETMRAQKGQFSFLTRYFVNQGVNTSKLVHCMEEIADQVMQVFINECNNRVLAHTVDDDLQEQVCNLMIASCHRFQKVHKLAIKYLDLLFTSFQPLLCNKKLVYLLLELIELLWKSCDAENINEYSPTYTFSIPKFGITIEFTDSYAYRREVLSRLCENGRKWLKAANACNSSDLKGILEGYLSESDFEGTVHMGRSIALEIGKSFSNTDYKTGVFPQVPEAVLDVASEFITDYSMRRRYRGQVAEAYHWFNVIDDGDLQSEKMINKMINGISDQVIDRQLNKARETLGKLEANARKHARISLKELSSKLHFAAEILIASSQVDENIISHLVWIPVCIFCPGSLKIGISIWNWVINEKPEIEKRIMLEIVIAWVWSVRQHKGLFSSALEFRDPFVNKMEYAPSDKDTRNKSIRYRSPELTDTYLRLLEITLDEYDSMSNHPLSRECRFEILVLGFKVLQSTRMEALIEYQMRERLYKTAFSWFTFPPRWGYGANKRAAIIEYKLMLELYRLVETDKACLDIILSSASKKSIKTALNDGTLYIGDKSRSDILKQSVDAKNLLLLFLESEISRVGVWTNTVNVQYQLKETALPLMGQNTTEENWKRAIRYAWFISPSLPIQLSARFKMSVVQNTVLELLRSQSHEAVAVAEALPLLLGKKLDESLSSQLKYLLYWKPVPPVTAVTYFSPNYNNHPLVLQYAMRSLEYHPVDVVFFYIPQIVQALRSDTYGYVERFIMESAKISQLFAHQIIWNMKANMFKDEECSMPDSLKPALDRVIVNIVESLSGEDKVFYEREFKFFEGVTSISGKLKPYIGKKTEEKKAKIDEEMKKIIVDVGVYLPSNPEGIVVGIDYNSGKPLQSHAKAPFLATFKIRKTLHESEEVTEEFSNRTDMDENPDDELKTIDVWQSAIFKVGDDCRQDVLALQLIAIFKNIFTSIGLDLYLYPYKVVATAPGCGVIDVIPKALSRAQVGTQKVNDLYTYFLTRYGGLDSLEFQKARNCFIQSAAAYSVVSYILQISDRHNGNIMLDDDGHIIHIDFGFILDISPGGIKFESSPFKLTTEMIQVMGGGAGVQPFQWFSELCIKAYLALRPYAEQITQCVALMLGSGLPCFKGESTLKRLQQRFQLDRTERAAAEFMMERIFQSFENRRTVFYDYFQKATNGIPY